MDGRVLLLALALSFDLVFLGVLMLFDCFLGNRGENGEGERGADERRREAWIPS